MVGARQTSDELRVLVVDDDAAVAEVVANILEETAEGMSAESVTSGQAALDRLRSSEFDCVVADYRMPGIDGLEVLDRTEDIAPGTARLLYTSHDEPNVINQAERTGVGFLAKDTDRDHYDRLAEQIRERAEAG